jgi:dolichyl-phosphate-mannose-protein mannosyltransferase
VSARAEAEFEATLAASADQHSEDEPTGSRLDRWWESRSPRLRSVVRWGTPAGIVGVAALARLWNLGHPASLVFDETFYVKDAWTLTQLGYEASWPAEADVLFNAGQADVFLSQASFVVHPPLGKWLIGLGMLAFGPENPVGWRIATALAGILAVVLLMLIAKRLTGSLLLASIGGLLFAIDGNAIVMSRVALLDNFLMLFALLGFGAVLLDREHSATRLALWMSRRNSDWGPALWWRPWLIAAGIAFGAAAAVKWNGLYFLAGFAVYTLVVDALARRRAGIPFWVSGTLLKQAPVSFLLTVPVAMLTYLASWTGWFLSENGYDRQWADQPGNAWSGPLAWVPHALQSLWHFQVSVYDYHVGESRPHGYQANPLTWLLMIRPTSMYYRSIGQGESGCASSLCGESISGIANPFIWWAATAAVVYLLVRLVRRREWPVGLVLMGVAVGYLPWLLYLGRTVFQFYTIVFQPYLLLALVLAIGTILGRADDPAWRRTSGIRTIAIYLVVVTAVSAFFWPLWSGTQADYAFIAAHWWLPTWR